jgi:hypothetical protein
MAIDTSGAPSNVSTEEAAHQIDALLSQDPAYTTEEPEKEQSKKESKAPVEDEETEEVEASEDESKEEEQTEEDSESETIELDPDEAMFEVEEALADGNKEVRKYSLNELKSQRMLQADYTRKTQELAKQRAEVQQDLAKGVEAERQQFMQALEMQQKLVVEMLAPEAQNLDQLAEDDPAEYIRVQNRLGKINSVVQKIQEEQQQALQKQREYLQTEVVPKEMELVKQKIPEWSDDLKPALVETGKKFGYSDEELGSIIDHRQIQVLYELNRLSKLEKQVSDKKQIASKKVVEKPKIVKSGTRHKEDSGSESFNRLKKSGRFQDAAKVFEARLGDDL